MLTDVSSLFREINTQMLGIYSENDLIADLRKVALTGDRQELKKYYWRGWYLARKRFPARYRLDALYLYDNQDQIVTTYRYNCQRLPKDIYASDYDVNAAELWEYVHSEEQDLLVSGYVNPQEKKNILRLVLKLHNYDESRQSLGYLVCDLDARVLTDIMHKYQSSERVLLWLQPFGDRSIARVGDEEGLRTKAYEKLSLDILEGGFLDETNLEVDGAYVVRLDYKDYNLSAFALVPQSLLTAAQASQNKILAIMTFVIIEVAALVAFLISRWISRPVEEMRSTIERIRGGERGLRISPNSWNVELRILGEEFNEMMDRISQMVTDEYEYKLLVERTEYKMLQAQINPHFLYNTLNTMSAIATAQNCPLVSGLCQSLSAIFRYCLDMTDEFSTVQKEVAHTRNYLYVMDVRNGGAVKVEYLVDEETLNCPLPRITLQPIVENAMNHGLRNVRRKDKLLRILAYLTGDKLVLEVEDNGTGMDATSMNEELRKADPKRVESGVSIGILNVNARIKKVFGPEYGLFVESEPGNGTKVRICVPARSPGKEIDGKEISGAGG
ncbi:MAG: histidine kinase [Blautia sp.]|nr:histidine kinase [Blautia sp.]